MDDPADELWQTHLEPGLHGGGVGKYLSLAALGDHVTLVCELDGYWQIESSYGTLAFER